MHQTVRQFARANRRKATFAKCLNQVPVSGNVYMVKCMVQVAIAIIEAN